MNLVAKKRLDIELMRIIAAFFVLYNHTGANGFSKFLSYDPHTFHYWLYLFLSISCKVSVPLFLVIAGALMLGREPEPVKYLWRHRVLHIFSILLVWSVFYYLLEVGEGNEKFNIFHFFTKLYSNGWNFSYWYLYAYLSMLIVLPLLQRFAQGLSDNDYKYALVLYIAFCMLVPCLQYRVFQDRHPLNVNVSIEWLATNIVVFPLAGYFLNCRFKNFWTKKRLLVLWGINIVAIVISCYMTYYRARITGICNEKDSQMFFGTFVLVNCVAIFATCQYLNSNTNILFRLKKPIVSVGGCTFGIYLIHVYFKNYTDTFKNLMSFLQDKLHSTPVLASLIYCVVLFMCGYVVTLIMKKIPLLRKIVS